MEKQKEEKKGERMSEALVIQQQQQQQQQESVSIKEHEETPEQVAARLGIVIKKRRGGHRTKTHRGPFKMTKSLQSRTLAYRRQRLKEMTSMSAGFATRSKAWVNWPQYTLEKVVCHMCFEEIKAGDRYMPGPRSAQVTAKFFCMPCSKKRY